MTQSFLILLLCLVGTATIGFATGYFLGWLRDVAVAAWSFAAAVVVIIRGLRKLDKEMDGLRADFLVMGLRPEPEFDLK